MNRFTATPDPVTAGGTLTICFTNTSLANTTITVGLTNGEGGGGSVQIALNDAGYGCVEWPVPETGWDLVTMSHSTSSDYSVFIV